jgi:hypothetical protein
LLCSGTQKPGATCEGSLGADRIPIGDCSSRSGRRCPGRELRNGAQRIGIKVGFELLKKIDILQRRKEMSIEVGNLAKSVQGSKPKGINWNGVLQAVITFITVIVTGIIFWQLIAGLAANSPSLNKKSEPPAHNALAGGSQGITRFSQIPLSFAAQSS